MHILTSINWDLKCVCFKLIVSLVGNLCRLTCNGLMEDGAPIGLKDFPRLSN